MKQQGIPARFLKLFEWFCDPLLFEELQGDLEEAFYENRDELGTKKARHIYRMEVLKMIRPSVIKNFNTKLQRAMSLPKNYLKTSLRAIKLHPFYVFANIFGLALALSISTIGYFNYRFNVQFNTYFDQATNLHKVHGLRTGESTVGYSSAALAPALQSSGIEAMRYLTKNLTLKDGDRLFSERVAFVDREFLNHFQFKTLTNAPVKAPENEEIILSESFALKLFNEPYPVGKLIKIVFPDKEEHSFLIKEVFEDLPTNTSFIQSAILPIDVYFDFYGVDQGDWSRSVDGTFISAEKEELDRISGHLASYLEVHNVNNPSVQISQFRLDNILEWPALEENLYRGRFRSHLHPSSVLGIAGSAITILLLACFNFINTSIALSGKRLKEIAVRKILGGTQKSTTTQFLIENTFMITMAVIISFGISWLLIPQYNTLFQQELIQMDEIPFRDILMFSGMIILIVTILAAAYPSMYVSRFSALKIFSKKLALSGKNRIMTILLTLQFALCFYNIFGLFINVDNAHFQASLDKGYDMEQVVNIPLNRPSQYQVLEDALMKHPRVQTVAGARNLIGFSDETEHLDYEGIEQPVSVIRVGQGYPEALGLRLVRGSFFVGADKDATEVLINKMTEDFFGKDLLNQQLNVGGKRYKVMGVVDDFNLRSVMKRDEITPTLIKLIDDDQYYQASVRISGMAEEANRTLEKIWYKTFPQELYRGFTQKTVMENASNINVIFLKINLFLAIITIVISILGLYTLISLKVLRKSKEFGVRKVLGASRSTIVHLLGKELYWMMGIAAIIGLSSSVWVFQSVFDIIYAYHIEPEVGHFIKSSLVVLSIVGVTVGYKVYKASLLNPSQQLRSE